ncbi:hypothetical protein [Umezawaea sp. NPDC059074]|uniref:hypothetical protein n=1 Tax=Umezawaea sp. NPDC059074 TaxID=3346716 RepID=UPI00367E9983
MSGRPEITPEMRAKAMTMPNNWLHVVDPTRDTAHGVPAEAVVGRYLIDADGRITDQYVPNPRYVARPPANELEAVMRLGTPADVLTAVLGADLILPADPTKAPRRHVVLRRDGREQVLDAFASPEALPRDWPPHWHRFTGVELAVVVDRLGEPVRLRLAESSDVRFDIRADALVDALRGVAV